MSFLAWCWTYRKYIHLQTQNNLDSILHGRHTVAFIGCRFITLYLFLSCCLTAVLMCVCRHCSFWVKRTGVRRRQLAGRKTWATSDLWWRVPEKWLMVRLHTHTHMAMLSLSLFTRPFERNIQNRGPALIQRVTLSWLMWQCVNLESVWKGWWIENKEAGARTTNKPFIPLTSNRDKCLFVCVGTCACVCSPDGFAFVCPSVVCLIKRDVEGLVSKCVELNISWDRAQVVGLNSNSSSFLTIWISVLKCNCHIICSPLALNMDKLAQPNHECSYAIFLASVLFFISHTLSLPQLVLEYAGCLLLILMIFKGGRVCKCSRTLHTPPSLPSYSGLCVCVCVCVCVCARACMHVFGEDWSIDIRAR